ncbi:hypothetical protein IEQ11_08190 [Lysobacter capsici]|uniref:hypothetical protein n=1 Tax=Lysobacter capsici TaxID=435897 RepID=UPI00177E892E|nr:hypothetical protein [Lysobacter capsici]UOF16611.1 hypothetical protein IEQ11_08190 [Lysobacter capsici]
MDKALAEEIAQIVLRGLWASKGEFFLAMTIWALVSGLFAFFGAYLAKLAEGRVADRRFETLTAQLAVTTTTVQRIQTEVAHGEWAQREWKSIRQRKLEELLGEAGAVEAFLDHCRNQLPQAQPPTPPPLPLDKFEVLVHLYFPELLDTGRAFATSARAAVITLHEFCIANGEAGGQDPIGLFNQHNIAIMAARRSVIDRRAALDVAAVQVVRTIFAGPPDAPEN